MRQRYSVLSVLLAAVLATSFAAMNACAMPLHPDIVEQLRAEGKLAEEGACMREAFARGVNNIPRNMLYEVEPGKTLSMISRQAIVILVDFSDNVADQVTYPPSHYEDLLFSVGTYPTGSMRDYYIENSYGNFEVVGETTVWLRMPQTYAYYVDGQRGFGDYPRNAQKLTEDAVAAADPYVDFSQYDNDGPDGIPDSGDDDGYIDALFVVHAGPGYEQTHDLNDIHSHAWSTYYPVAVDGVYAYSYSMEPEDGKIGVFCHELGHVLGCPDLYDYDYDSRGVGYWSLMASGSWGNGGITPVHFDAWNKILLGYISPVVPAGNLIDVEVGRVEDNPVAYKVWTNGSMTNEYFLLEHRRKVLFDAYARGEGIVIYHVDENMWNNDDQRCGPGYPHYLVAVEQADGECDLEYYNNAGDAGDPWPGSGGTYNPNHAFNRVSTPNTNNYSNALTGVSIYNIHLDGDDAYVSIAVAPVSPAVEVVAPDGGEVFEAGTQDTIRWIAFDDVKVSSVSIMLSTDGGSTFPNVIATGEANDSVFVWTVNNVNSNQCRIKVRAFDDLGNLTDDISDANFAIYDASGISGRPLAELKIVAVAPNPAAGGTRVVFSAPRGVADARVYDVAGRLVRALEVAKSPDAPDVLQACWDGRDGRGRSVKPGVYFLRVTSGRGSETARLAVTR